MLLVTGSFRVPPGRIDAARAAMTAMIAASRAEPGCLDYAYAEDLLEPGLIRVVERWTDRAALDAHLASRHLAEWRAAWPGLEIGARDLTFVEVDRLESF